MECFKFLKLAGLRIGIFVSDRHRSIAKWIRENEPNTRHFFAIWHVARSVSKKLLQASKESGCDKIKAWIKAVRGHLYWCATSTKQGFGDLIVAKWTSFLRHVNNRHSDHPDPLYSQCAHGELTRRLWIKQGEYAQGHFSMIERCSIHPQQPYNLDLSLPIY